MRSKSKNPQVCIAKKMLSRGNQLFRNRASSLASLDKRIMKQWAHIWYAFQSSILQGFSGRVCLVTLHKALTFQAFQRDQQ